MKNDQSKIIKTHQLQQQIEELTNHWKRALADYQNLERRVQAEKEEFARFANSQLLLKILAGLDSLEKAQEHLKDEGLDLAIKQLKEGLAQEGLEQIETKGKDFNPEEMEGVDFGEGEDEKVLDEIRTGYKLNHRVLRPAQVRVGKKGEN